MKTTGIVRRLDELGRIVIPREYRRLYSINIGDPLEIVAMENGNIVISKLSSEADLVALGGSACESLATEFGMTALLSDLKAFVGGFGNGYADIVGKELPAELIKQIKTRGSGSMVVAGYGANYIAYAPIYGPSDVFGGIFLLCDQPLDDVRMASLKVCGKLIGESLQKF